MPINTVICPTCGASVNYAVDNKSVERTLTCPRCKGRMSVSQASLTARVVEDLQALADQDAKSQAAEQRFAAALTTSADAVDESLNRAKAVFREARTTMEGIAGNVEIADVQTLVDQYSVADDARTDASNVGLRATVRRKAVDAIANKFFKGNDRAGNALFNVAEAALDSGRAVRSGKTGRLTVPKEDALSIAEGLGFDAPKLNLVEAMYDSGAFDQVMSIVMNSRKPAS